MRFGPGLWRGLLAAGLLGVLLLGPGGAAAATASPTIGAASSSTIGAASVPALPAWSGGVDLYRAGTFSTQQTWLWCTAADIQITRNIVFGGRDHSYAGQQADFTWMRAHNRYRLPLSAGVDAAGWAAGFAHFVDARYSLVASTSFDAALRSAVVNLRRTSLPVGITVDRGNHAWLLTGFTATADPAATGAFTVTSVRVVGPLYGLQSRNGYDMPPDTRLTPAELRRFFTPWYYAPVRMVWDGRYVSIQPVAAIAPVAPSPEPRPTPAPTAVPSTASTGSPVVPSSVQPAAAAPATPSPSTPPGLAAVGAGGTASEPPAIGPAPAADVPVVDPSVGFVAVFAAVGVPVLLLVVAALALRRVRAPRG